MLLIVHNLPKEINSVDVRQLIQEQCGLRDVILDNLLDEGPGKRITVGLAEEEDAAILMQKLNGLHYKKCQLYVEDIRKKNFSAPSFSMLIPAGLQPQVQKSWIQYPVQKTTPFLNQMNQNNMPYYMTQDSNNTNFGRPTQSTKQNTSIFNRNYQYPSNCPIQTPKANNHWAHPLFSSNTNKNQAAGNAPSFENYQNDRDKQGDRRDNATQLNWRDNKSPPSKRHGNFGNFSQSESRFGDTNFKRNKLRDPRLRDNDRSPPRGRNLFRENKKDDRTDDFDSSGCSSSNRWYPSDEGTFKNERQSAGEQNIVFGRQRERVFDQHERRNDLKRNYEQRDSYPRENIQSMNVFQTFSSKPDNSAFTKSNRSIFDKVIGSRRFGETNQNKNNNSSPKPNASKSKVNFPAPKRARFDLPPQYFGNKKYINPNAPTNKPTDMQKIMTRHTNWCSQSASLLAKEVLKNASTSKIDSVIFKAVFKKLRECLMARLDVIMGDRIANNLDEILSCYRTKFDNRDDIPFFKAVMEKVERENEEKSDEVTVPKLASEKQHQESGKLTKGPIISKSLYSQNVNKEKKQQIQESGNLNKKGSSLLVNPYSTPGSTMKPNLATGTQKGLQNRPNISFTKDPRLMQRLPKYPNSDKQGFKHFQKTALLELEDGFYTMEPEYENAVDEEVNKLVECYIETCEPSSNKDEENIRNKIIKSTADEFKKIIKLHVTKRVLNVTEGLTVRIFSTPKPPPKAALDAFLKKHGAISLKKSDTTKMFVANCDSYENYDRLLALQTASFGKVTIHIKPFQVLGPITKKNKTNQSTGGDIEDFTKDIDKCNIDLTNDLINDEDVMLIEDYQSEVVVIRDEFDKSTNSPPNDKVDVNNEVREINDLKAPHSNDKVDVSDDRVDNSNDITAAANVKVAVSNETIDKVDDSNVKDATCNETVEKIYDCNDKIAASNVKVNASIVKVAASKKTIDDSNDKIAASNEQIDKVVDSSVRVGIFNGKFNNYNEKVDNSSDEVDALNDKIEYSINKVPNSQSKEQIDTCLDDILNDAGEILDEDLEDF